MPRTTIRTEDIADSEVTTAKILDGTIATGDMAVDPTNASNLSSGSVPTAQLGNVDTTSLETDIALLGFKVAANGSLAAYNLKDQTVDAFEDATGVDASGSTGETRNASNYYSGGVVGSYSIDAFTTAGSDTWTVPANTSTAEILVVAGGGAGRGGQHRIGGGGGGGGIVHHATYSLASSGTTYNLTVGAGGACGTMDYTSATCADGDDSTFDTSGTTLTMTASGGGMGGYSSTYPGRAGGSGGGAGGSSAGTGSSDQSAVSGATIYGNAGGGFTSSYGAGGGGAGEAGNTDGTGHGGDGAYFANFDSYGTDTSNAKPAADGLGSGKGYFGGGGGGSTSSGNSSYNAAGYGGGGIGKGYSGAPVSGGQSGQANTGGGGGASGGSGGGSNQRSGGAGGSGIILIRHRPLSYNDMTLVSNSTTASSAPTTGDLVMTYTNGAGTATVNTDLKAYVSRDNGTTYTQATLSSQGTTGGHTILTAHNVDISSQPSGTSMRYKITTHNQSVSKETRVQAVSLGWA